MELTLGVPEVLLALVTILSPLFSAIAIQSKWTSQVKNAVAVGISVLLAAGYLIATGAIGDLSNLPGTILAVYGLQQLVYQAFMKELTKKVEAATSVNQGEAIVVEEGVKNEVLETGKDQAEVIIVDQDQTPVEPDYVPEHRGDTNPRG